jgi:uncharacterized protein YgfB (UPF0149 family)
MSTDSRGVVSRFDFEELQNQLLEQGLEASPADLHGCLCGLLAAGADPQAEAGIAGLDRAMALDLHGDLAEQAMAMYEVTALALASDEFDFYPLLPDDSLDIASRTAALAGWCRSFLAVYAHAGTGGEKRGVPGDSSEILRDLVAIADAEVDEAADEEESERSFQELAEYIRIAALNAYADNVATSAPEIPRKPDGAPLH